MNLNKAIIYNTNRKILKIDTMLKFKQVRKARPANVLNYRF